MGEKMLLRTAYGEALEQLGEENPKVVVLDADLSSTTMTCLFARRFPERFFNAGIAEANMTGMAAGLASMGFVVFMSTFAMFGAARAYEQLRNSVAFSDLPVKLVCSHGGLTAGEDGGCHQCLEDLALMRALPNMTVLSPCDAIEMGKAVRAVAEYPSPVYIRMPKCPVETVTSQDAPFEIGKANALAEYGSDAVVFATGVLVPEALEAARELKRRGVGITVVNIHTLKPLDRDAVLKYAGKTGRVITAEDHSVIGGLGDAVAEALTGRPLKFKKLGVNDRFGQSGSAEELLREYGLSAEHLAENIQAMM